MEGGAPVIMESHGRPVEKHQLAANEEFFHLVFSNKTENDERVLAIRAELVARAGLSIWQQTTNIPKDSDNWFNEWYPSASKAIKIPCYLTVKYLKSPYCMKEFGIALAKGKLLAIALEPLADICAVDPSEFPYASNALAYLEGGGQVIFDDREDTVAEILKFTPEVVRLPAAAPAALGSPPAGVGPPRSQSGGASPAPGADAADAGEPIGALLASLKLEQYEAFFRAQEYDFVTDLLEADDADVQELVRGSQMKKPAAKRFLKAVAARKAVAGGGAAAMAVQMEAQTRVQQAQIQAQAAALESQQAEVARKLKELEDEQRRSAAARARAEQEAADAALAQKLAEQERAQGAAAAAEPEPQAEDPELVFTASGKIDGQIDISTEGGRAALCKHDYGSAMCGDAVMRTGVHRAEFELFSHKGVQGWNLPWWTGVCTVDFAQEEIKRTEFEETEHGWSLNGSGGRKHNGDPSHGGPDFNMEGLDARQPGTKILMTLDCGAGTLRASVNGRELGVVHAALPASKGLCWAVSIGSDGYPAVRIRSA